AAADLAESLAAARARRQSPLSGAASPAADAGLELAPPARERMLRVAVRLLEPLEHEVERRLKRDGAFEVRRHVPRGAIAGGLPTYALRHALERRHDLRAVDDAVMEPVRDVLRRDPQRRSILHQAYVVDVGHLRAADAVLDPAHHVAEDALRV